MSGWKKTSKKTFKKAQSRLEYKVVPSADNIVSRDKSGNSDEKKIVKILTYFILFSEQEIIQNTKSLGSQQNIF